MLEAPEVEPHVHHKTGHGLADKIFAVLAVFLSCVSVFIAVSHGRTMERLVAANSWPNLSYSTGNENDAGTREDITLSLKNTGVGPARIDTLELFYKGVPQSNAASLIKACCGKGPISFGEGLVIDEVLPAREQVTFLTFPKSNLPVLWNALNTERFNIRVRACYCSVFDECWARDSQAHRPVRLDQCTPSQPIQFQPMLPK